MKKNATRRVLCSKNFKFKVLERGEKLTVLCDTLYRTCCQSDIHIKYLVSMYTSCVGCTSWPHTSCINKPGEWKTLFMQKIYICIVCLNLPWFPYTFCRIFYCVRIMLIHNIMSFDVPSAQRTTITICSRHQWLDDSLRILPLHFI